MARKRSSPAEDLIHLVSMLPWWVGVVLAGVAYGLLHHLSTPTVVAGIQPGQIGAALVGSMGAALANVGQYVVPLICLGGAGLSAWKRYQRRALLTNVKDADSTGALDGMSWREFEMLVGEAYRVQGYTVAETGGVADGGVDLVLSKGTEKFLVQCKQWKARRVGVEIVRELYGVMAARGAAGGFVVTSGRFTADAKAFAEGRDVKLVDGHRLLGLIQQGRQSAAARPASLDRQWSTPPLDTKSLVPSCPRCQASMVRRTARKGANAGAPFWGCSTYPTCRGTRPAD